MLMMFALCVLWLGVYLCIRPRGWWRLNAPAEQKHTEPSAAQIRTIRLRGVVFLLGGIALLVVQVLKSNG